MKNKNILKRTSAIVLSSLMIMGTANANTLKVANTKNIVPNYKINSQISIPNLKLSKNTFIADYKYVDVNGDKVKDHVILTGNKENKASSYFNNINIIVQDGKSKKFIKSVIGKDSGGYEPNMFIGDFNGDKIPDVFVNMPTGGSGGIVNYGLVSFRGNSPKALFNYEKFNQGIDFDVKFLPDYKAQLKSKSLNKSEVLNLEYKKDIYNEVVYDANGKLKENMMGWVDTYSELKPEDRDKDGVYELYGTQRVCGSCHADSIAHIMSAWKWDGNKIKLDEVSINKVIDYKRGDVNGNGSKDMVTLLGTMEFAGESFYVRDININVYDDKDNTIEDLSLGNMNEGYEPSIILKDFNGDKVDEMLVSIPSGGSGGFSTYSLMSYKGNKAANLFNQEKFNDGLDFNIVYKDGFKVDVTVKEINKKYELDVSDKKDVYIENKIYSKDGKLIDKLEGMNNPLGEIITMDVDKDGKDELIALQRVCGTANADTLGYVKSTWKVENSSVKLIDVNVVKDFKIN